MMRDRKTRIREGMPVVDSLGRAFGEVGHLVVGEDSRRARFITVHEGMFGKRDHLVPCEAIERVDGDGRIVLGLAREHVEMMPDYEGRPPDEEETRHAYELLGGRSDDPVSGESSHMVPFADTIPGAPPRERLIIIAAEERVLHGYADEWPLDEGR